MGPSEPYYGFWFRLGRFIVRLYLGKNKVCHPENLLSPAIYVSRHQNMHGPVHTMAYLPVPVHIWSMYMFMDPKVCYDHFMNFTFTQRYRWPRWKAALVGKLVCHPISACMHSMGAIPVYRGQRDVIKTFELSAKVLQKGENIVIFPDIMYDDTSSQSGSMYTGYLHLARTYHQKTGKELPIIPLYCTQTSGKMIIGKAIHFSSQVPFREEKERVSAAVRDALDQLVIDSEALQSS